MKVKFAYLIVLLMLLVGCGKRDEAGSSMPSIAAAEDEGTIVGNGGGNIALDFSVVGLNSIEYLLDDFYAFWKRYDDCVIGRRNNPDSNPADDFKYCGAPPEISKKKLLELKLALRITKVFAVSRRLCPIVNPKCSEDEALVAVNFPSEKSILVNIERWKALDRTKQILIAMHEYLGIAKLETDQYTYSARYKDIVYSDVFHVDFTIDYFKEELLKLKISDVYVNDRILSNQIELNHMIWLSLGCLKLVDRRYPEKLVIRELGLKIGGYPKIINRYGYKVGKRLELPNDSNLQACYNKMILDGLTKQPDPAPPASEPDRETLCHERDDSKIKPGFSCGVQRIGTTSITYEYAYDIHLDDEDITYKVWKDVEHNVFFTEIGPKLYFKSERQMFCDRLNQFDSQIGLSLWKPLSYRLVSILNRNGLQKVLRSFGPSQTYYTNEGDELYFKGSWEVREVMDSELRLPVFCTR